MKKKKLSPKRKSTKTKAASPVRSKVKHAPHGEHVPWEQLEQAASRTWKLDD